MRMALYIVGLTLAVPLGATPREMSKSDFLALAGRCAPGVDAFTLMAIATVESSLHTLVINDNSTGKSTSFSSIEEAVGTVDALLQEKHSVDVGLMQINSANFSKLGLTAESAFDPCRSVRAASLILGSRYHGGETAEERQWSLRGAISAYNTGSLRRGFENGYVHKVEAAAGIASLSATSIRTLGSAEIAPGFFSAASVPTLMPTAGETPIGSVTPGSPIPVAAGGPQGIELETWDIWKSYARRQAERHAAAGDEDRAPYRQNDHVLFE